MDPREESAGGWIRGRSRRLEESAAAGGGQNSSLQSAPTGGMNFVFGIVVGVPQVTAVGSALTPSRGDHHPHLVEEFICGFLRHIFS